MSASRPGPRQPQAGPSVTSEPKSAPVLGAPLIAAYAAAAAYLAVATLLAELAGRPFEFAAREPGSALAETDCAGAECGLAGMLSTATILVWVAGGACALLAASTLRGLQGAREPARTLAVAGALTLLLVADDAFLLHDYVLSDLVSDYSQTAAPAIYGLLGLILLREAARYLDRRDVVLLVLAGVLLAASAAMDRIEDFANLAEDGAKWFGVVTWTACLIRASRSALTRRPA